MTILISCYKLTTMNIISSLQHNMKNTKLSGSDLQDFTKRRQYQLKMIEEYAKRINEYFDLIGICYKEVKYLDKQSNSFSKII